MILTRLRLHNFRQYRGEHEVTFSTDRAQNVTTITGANGAGKTSIFLALNWCLYGLGDDRGALLSKGLTSEPSGFVEVHFVHDRKRYVAERSVHTQQGTEVSGDLALHEVALDGDWQPVPNPSMRLNVILPSDARKYFFFDGEKIDEMSRPGHEKDVAEAVRSVMKMRVLERAVRHLSKVEKDLGREVQADEDVNQETRRLSASIERREAELDQKRASLDAVREREAQLKEQLGTIKHELADLHDVADRMQRERGLEAELGELLDPLDTRITRMRERLDALMPAVVTDAFGTGLEVLEAHRQASDHQGWHAHQLDDLLDAGVCVCGTPLAGETALRVKELREAAAYQPSEIQLASVAGMMMSVRETEAERVEQVAAELEHLERVRERSDDVYRELEEVRASLARHRSTDVREMERDRTRVETELRKLAAERGGLKQSRDDLDRALKALRNELKRSNKQGDAHSRAARKYELASRSAYVAQKILDEYRENTRSRLEEVTNRIFSRMIWKHDHFDRVEITDSYALDVVDRYGESALNELSAGERQVLSLAFILAMTEVSGEEAPLVIDTPFGRISDAPLQNIATALPELSDQLVLLLTDRELTGAAATSVAPRVGRSFRLEFDEATGQTSPIETTGDEA